MTDLRANVDIALRAMASHRLRSFLTILGLTIGVATLMAVMTIIQGANTFVAEKIANLGTDVFRIRKTPFATTDFEEAWRARRNPDVLYEDAAAVRDACSLCQLVGASVDTRAAVRHQNQELRDIQVLGYTANMAEISTRGVERGRFFSESENRHAALVCMLGSSISEQLFPSLDPIGRTVRVGKEPLRVIGTFEPIGAVLGQDQDSYVVVPVDTFRRMFGLRHSFTLEIKVAREGAVFEQAQDQARVVMRARRGIKGNQKEDFYIGTASSYIEL